MNNNFRIDPNDLLTTSTSTSTPPTTNTNTNCAAYKKTEADDDIYYYILLMTDVDGKVDLNQNTIAYIATFPASEVSFPPCYKTDSVSEYTFQLYSNENILTYNKSNDTCSITNIDGTFTRNPIYTTYKQFYDASFAARPVVPP